MRDILLLFLLVVIFTSSFQIKEMKKVYAPDGNYYDFFGVGIDISDNQLLVGARRESSVYTSAGAAYMYYKDKGGVDNWGYVAKLVALKREWYAEFGCSVALSGSTALVGASGSNAGYVFEKDHGGVDGWGQVKKLVPHDYVEDKAWDCGWVVAIEGDTLAMGCPSALGGLVYVYKKNAITHVWEELKKLQGVSDGDLFGTAIRIDSDFLIIGAEGCDAKGSNSGCAYMFYRNEGGPDNWGIVKRLEAPDGEPYDTLGALTISVSGEVSIAGALYASDYEGSAYIFVENEGGHEKWGFKKKLIPSYVRSGDHFGFQVSLSGKLAVAGSYWSDVSGSYSGTAFAFARDHGGTDNWGEVMRIDPSDAKSEIYFGTNIVVRDDIIVVGALGGYGRSSFTGAAYVFYADLCELGTHSCSSCTRTSVGSYQCTCPQGYTADGVFCVQNECDLGIDSCLSNATCYDTRDSYYCGCPSGSFGDGFTTCDDLNECDTRTHQCDIDAVCTNKVGGYNCTCLPGFSGDGFNCDDIDECSLGTHGCSSHSMCINTHGGYSCDCKYGFQGDGFSCSDIDECLVGTDNCHWKSICNNTVGGYTCTCQSGFTGNGYYCDDIDECKLGLHDCNTTCMNTFGSFTCVTSSSGSDSDSSDDDSGSGSFLIVAIAASVVGLLCIVCFVRFVKKRARRNVSDSVDHSGFQTPSFGMNRRFEEPTLQVSSLPIPPEEGTEMNNVEDTSTHVFSYGQSAGFLPNSRPYGAYAPPIQAFPHTAASSGVESRGEGQGTEKGSNLFSYGYTSSYDSNQPPPYSSFYK